MKILVVDDDDLQRDLVAGLLAGEGYDVASAACGADALASARERSPDVLVLDLLLPDVDGGTLLARMRSDPALSGVRVVVTTGMRTSHVKQLVRADATLFKPFEFRELVDAVATLAPSPAA